MISSEKFYSNYYGHPVADLQKLQTHLKSRGKKSFIYLAGDSSLDSKHWFGNVSNALNGYETILDPPRMKEDISYYLNSFCSQENPQTACINTAVEEATVGEKSETLNAQDRFIRNNITPDDILIVSVGGNDIALHPSVGTMFNMLKLMSLNSEESIKNDFENCWGVPHFIEMFRDQIQSYIEQLTSVQKPKKVIICMIYYPCEKPSGWAQQTLSKLNYFEQPQFLQLVIQQLFKHATQQIRVNVPVHAFPMYSVMDGKNPQLYCEGVEPSARGNYFLARSLFPICTQK